MKPGILFFVFFLGIFSQTTQAVVTAFDHPHIPRQLILKFKPNLRVSVKDVIEPFAGQILSRFTSSGAYLVNFAERFAEQKALANLAKSLSKLSFVEYAVPNSIVSISQIPTDPFFNKQYGLNNLGSNGKLGADVAALKAWDIERGSRDVLVAIIDTGIDYEHKDLSNNYWLNPQESGLDAQGRDKRSNGIDDDGNGFIDDYRGWDFVNNDNDPMDDHSHGTHCAGIVGAEGNNGLGVCGANWQVSMVGIKFLDARGSGSLDKAIAAIDYATSIGADIMSASWGGNDASPPLKEAIARAAAKNILFVAAAGNSSSSNDIVPYFPCSFDLPNIISVAASNSYDNLSGFSNYGLSVHLAAPGSNIFSTVRGNLYKELSGTSMATPLVAGAAALVKAHFPKLSAVQIKDRLLDTVDVVPALEGKVKSQGRLNLYNALEEDTTPPGKITNLRISEIGSNFFKIEFSPTGDDGNVGQAKAYVGRVSDTPIRNEADWQKAKAISLTNITTTGMRAKAQGFGFNEKGYFSLRARDNAGNWGELSEAVFFQLASVQIYARFDGSLEGIKTEGAWGIEPIEPGSANSVYSDSPGAKYGSEINAAMILPDMTLPSEDTTLVFDTSYDIETNFDYGFVEASVDQGRTWKSLLMIQGYSPVWQKRTISLQPILSTVTTKNIRIRFRLVSDYSIGRDGWYVDNIAFVGP